MYSAVVPKDLDLSAQATAGVMSSPGLLRYRSAPPSTVLGDVCGDFLAGVGYHRMARHDDSAAETVLAAGHSQEKPPRPIAAHCFQQEDVSSMASQHLVYQSPAMKGMCRTASSSGTDPATGSILLRQSSSPAGFINHLNMGSFRNGETRLRGQLSFSSRQGSVMSQISEIMASEGLGGSSNDAEAGSVPTGYPMGSGAGACSGWEEHASPSTSLLSADSVSKRRHNVPPRVIKQQQQHSKPSRETMTGNERFLQFQHGAVPCKLRAKRGCATHPRSIAERVRRTKISERIRRLQELVPNMDKQTNTSDMLDLAVDYIKELQMQVKVLKDDRASCTCTAASRHKKHFATGGGEQAEETTSSTWCTYVRS